jgi:hypothetical protein
MRTFGYKCTNGADIAERSNNMYVYTEDNGLSLHPDTTLNAVLNTTIEDRSDLYLGVVNFDKHISADGEDVVQKIQIIYSSSHSNDYYYFDMGFLRNCIHVEDGRWFVKI